MLIEILQFLKEESIVVLLLGWETAKGLPYSRCAVLEYPFVHLPRVADIVSQTGLVIVLYEGLQFFRFSIERAGCVLAPWGWKFRKRVRLNGIGISGLVGDIRAICHDAVGRGKRR